jgi:hypothetical protein
MKKVIEHFGSQVKLANALNKKFDLNITTSHIYYWIKCGVPIKRAKQIEILTAGLFNRQYLRPDIFD